MKKPASKTRLTKLSAIILYQLYLIFVLWSFRPKWRNLFWQMGALTSDKQIGALTSDNWYYLPPFDDDFALRRDVDLGEDAVYFALKCKHNLQKL
jgi:hypothetical protein